MLRSPVEHLLVGNIDSRPGTWWILETCGGYLTLFRWWLLPVGPHDICVGCIPCMMEDSSSQANSPASLNHENEYRGQP